MCYFIFSLKVIIIHNLKKKKFHNNVFVYIKTLENYECAVGVLLPCFIKLYLSLCICVHRCVRKRGAAVCGVSPVCIASKVTAAPKLK